MALDVGYVSAVAAGAISFLSPCVLPLVPPYLCYMAGVSVDDFRDGAAATRTRTALVGSALAFVLGFSTVFVALGAGASTVGGLMRAWQQELAIVSGILIIFMGLNFLGIIRIPFLSREARFQANVTPANAAAAYVMGLAFAFGWTPCIGPQLGAILSIAATEASVSRGTALLAVYAIGLGIPFLLAAGFIDRAMGVMNRLKRHMKTIERVMGLLLVGVGVALMTGAFSAFSFWLLETFPALGALG
jgi:cytochrome c-type biogenesis protein